MSAAPVEVLLFRARSDSPEQSAVEVFKTQEILRKADLKLVKPPVSTLEGLADIRGEVVPVLNLAKAMHGQPEPAAGLVVIVELADRKLGLEVAEVVSVVNVAGEAVQPASPLIGENSGVSDILRLNDGTMAALVDIHALMDKYLGTRSPLAGVKVLVVEDSASARAINISTLKALGATAITEAVDGQAAWELLEKGLSVDLVLSDVEMPRMDGYQLTRKLKDTRETEHVKVVLCSSRMALEYQRAGNEAGADAYVGKLGSSELAKALTRVWSA